MLFSVSLPVPFMTSGVPALIVAPFFGEVISHTGAVLSSTGSSHDHMNGMHDRMLKSNSFFMEFVNY